MAEITKLVVFLLWKTAVIMAMQGYLLTGPKSLLPNSIETFCVSIEGSYDHTAANCTLDLIAREDDVVYASVNQMIKGELIISSRSSFGNNCFMLSPQVRRIALNYSCL